MPLCGHALCIGCMQEHINTRKLGTTCPMCRRRYTEEEKVYIAPAYGKYVADTFLYDAVRQLNVLLINAINGGDLRTFWANINSYSHKVLNDIGMLDRNTARNTFVGCVYLPGHKNYVK